VSGKELKSLKPLKSLKSLRLLISQIVDSSNGRKLSNYQINYLMILPINELTYRYALCALR